MKRWWAHLQTALTVAVAGAALYLYGWVWCLALPSCRAWVISGRPDVVEARARWPERQRP